MKTFATSNINSDESYYRDVHVTSRIELEEEDGRTWFYFYAVCRSNDRVEAINMLGHSESEDTKGLGGAYIDCDECK
jgi:hypothetical protein